jgi:hypothetical protein
MSEKAHRFPRWFKVLTLLGVAVIGIIGLGYYIWAHGAGTELDAQVAAYQAAGEPIEPGDFLVAHIDDDDNAAVALREAARIDQASREWKAADPPGELGLPLRDKEIAAFRAVIAVNPNAFAGVDDAMKRKAVDWQIPMKSPVISVLLPDLNEQRQLSRLIFWSAYLHHQNGDDAAALKDLDRIIFISRTVDLQPTLVSHLVALAQMGMVTKAVQDMAPDLKIGSDQGDASPQQISQLIAKLLDDKPLLAGRRRAFRGERMIELDVARCIASGRIDFASIASGKPATPATAALGVALKPMALGDGLIMIRRTSAILAALEASPDWPTYKLKSPGELPAEITNAKFRHALANITMPAFAHAAQSDYRGMATRRLAAVALAIRWYAVDHGGKTPEKLSDLVPQYLPAVPLDAFAVNQSLRYIPDPTRPILYSVSQDGTDDGGSERVTVKNPRSSGAPDKWLEADYVLHLTRQPRPPEEPPDDGVGGVSTRPAATLPATSPAP